MTEDTAVLRGEGVTKTYGSPPNEVLADSASRIIVANWMT